MAQGEQEEGIEAGFFKRVYAAFHMARDVGIGPAVERIWLFGLAQVQKQRRRRQFLRMRLREPIIRDILGQRMLLDPAQQGIDRDLLTDGIREPIATGHFMRILRDDDVVLEIGANIGYYAIIESRLCRKIYAAEPHPGNFQRLIGNLELNNTKNVECFNIALGSKDGPITLNCSELSNWHSCRSAPTESGNAIEVEGRSIDSFVANRTQPTFIKMDVEGYELEVLRGATETLRHVRGVFLELHGDMLSAAEIRETLDILSNAGLSPSMIIQYDWPGLSRIYPPSRLDRIYSGDRGTFELFFTRTEETSDDANIHGNTGETKLVVEQA